METFWHPQLFFNIWRFCTCATLHFCNATCNLLTKFHLGKSIALFFSIVDMVPPGHRPASNYMFKVNNRNTRLRYEICSKLTIKTLERRHWRRAGVFIINLEHILHLVLVFLVLTLSRYMPAEQFSMVCLIFRVTLTLSIF